MGGGCQKRNPLSKTDTISAESTSLRGDICVDSCICIHMTSPVEGADAEYIIYL